MSASRSVRSSSLAARIARARGFSVLTALFALAPVSLAQWTVVNLHPAGATSSRALGVHGQQQVGVVDGNAALWFGTAGSYLSLGPGAALATDGVRQVGNSAGRGRMWSGSAASYVELTAPSPLDTYPSAVSAIDGGSQVGWYQHLSATYALHWNDTTASATDLIGSGGTTVPHGVHAGQVVGSAGTGTTVRARIWTEGTNQFVVLHPDSAMWSEALGVHAGCQVGWSRDGGAPQHATMWFGTSESRIDLHPGSPSTSSIANAVFGSIQVGEADGRAGLWTGSASSWVDLAAFLPPGYDSSRATGVWTDANGITQVSGYARRTGGGNEAILWVGNVGAATVFCAGDGSGTACPCGNQSHAESGSGCLNSTGFGARLSGHGRASVGGDTFQLVANATTGSFVLFFQGTTRVAGGAGAAFGDGLLCAGGSVVRLGQSPNVAGTSRYPGPGDAAISVRGSDSAGDVRTYQAWYRNAAAFCTPATYGTSNGLDVTWQP